jgi:hypothetical protein
VQAVSKRISSTAATGSTFGIGGITETGRGGGTETGGMIGSGGGGSVIIVGGSAGAPSRGACGRVSNMRSRSRSCSIAPQRLTRLGQRNRGDDKHHYDNNQKQQNETAHKISC